MRRVKEKAPKRNMLLHIVFPRYYCCADVMAGYILWESYTRNIPRFNALGTTPTGGVAGLSCRLCSPIWDTGLPFGIVQGTSGV